jgi:undecaprenyl-diphosphatase
MRAILTSLDRRWRRRQAGFPPLRWQTCLFITANIVLLSALLLDQPVGAGMKHMAPPIHFLGRMLTDFGESGWIIVVSAFLCIEGWVGSRLLKSCRCRYQAAIASRIGGYLLVSIVLSGLVANILKRIIGRARPVHFDDWGILGFSPFSNSAAFQSFPSGHATTIGAFFAALIFLFPRYRIIFAICAIWLAATRVMVGAHYPSDVVAGLALGAWFSFMTAIVYSRYGLLFKTDENGWPIPRLPILRK